MRRGVIAVAALLWAEPASAQWGVWVGDSLLAEGRLASAESAYYAAARARPRDPVARTALGKFLAARGGTRAGAVLLEALGSGVVPKLFVQIAVEAVAKHEKDHPLAVMAAKRVKSQ